MQVNYLILTIVAVLAVSLVVFLIWRNQKDEKEFMDELNGTPQNPESGKDDVDML